MRRRNETGFTLVEVIVAAAVMALALGALTATLTMARRSSEKATERINALNIGRRHMETLLGLSYYNSALLPGTHQLENVTNNAVVYAAQYEVRMNSQYALVKDVELRVGWQSLAGNATNTVTLHHSLSQGLHP